MEEVPSVPDQFSYSVLFREVTNRSVRGRSYEDTLYFVQLTDYLTDLIDKLERERVIYQRQNVKRLLGQ